MAKQDNFYNEKENKRKGIIISLIMHILLLLVFFISFFARPEIQQAEGIQIAFGDPYAGSDDAPEVSEQETQAASSSSPTAVKTNNEAVTSQDREEEAPVKAIDKKSPKPSEVDKNKAKEASEAKAKTDALEKAEADRKAAEKAKAEKAAADAANQKKKYADLLGKGKGNNNSDGNKGKVDGDPDGKALEGISKGTGKVGGGLTGRGIEYSPSFSDNSQKTGKVSLTICVNSDGKVSKADFTQKGSTTSDSYLVDLAKRTAMKYRFSKSDIDSQCGTVTIDFRVQ